MLGRRAADESRQRPAGGEYQRGIRGGVTLRLTPLASLRIDALSLSGDVSTSDLALDASQAGSHRLSGNLGAGTNSLSVRTTSGSIRLVRGS